MSHQVDVGDDALINFEIEVNGALTDPTTLSLTIRRPDGITQTYVYTTNPELIRVSVGRFVAAVPATMPGLWTYRWAATGTGKGVEQGTYNVRRSLI